MAYINRIDVQVWTGTKSGAGTDGEVYIGIAGREFHIDTNVNDFERGSSRVYVLGSGANIKWPAKNNPRTPQLRTEDLDKFPVYLRFEPKGAGPNWNLERIIATVNPGARQIKFDNIRLAGSPDLWLGQKYGKFLFLSRQ